MEAFKAARVPGLLRLGGEFIPKSSSDVLLVFEIGLVAFR